MPENASIETWIAAAGFDFDILEAMVKYEANGIPSIMDNRFVLYRSDNHDALSIVSDRYQVVQPATVMEFFRDLCADFGFKLETAGVLKNGGMYWALAETPLNGEINGDTHKGYVLLATSCDGSLATHAKLTAVRVVCNNTLSLAMQREGGKHVTIKHSTTFNPAKVKQDLELVDFEASWGHFRETMENLGQIRVSDDRAKEFFADLLRPKAKPRQTLAAQNFNDLIQANATFGEHKATTDKAPVERAIRGLDTLYECYQRAPGAAPGTAYGLVQGVTRYIDHERGKNGDKRLQSAWFGQGDQMKQAAIEHATQLA